MRLQQVAPMSLANRVLSNSGRCLWQPADCRAPGSSAHDRAPGPRSCLHTQKRWRRSIPGKPTALSKLPATRVRRRSAPSGSTRARQPTGCRWWWCVHRMGKVSSAMSANAKRRRCRWVFSRWQYRRSGLMPRRCSRTCATASHRLIGHQQPQHAVGARLRMRHQLSNTSRVYLYDWLKRPNKGVFRQTTSARVRVTSRCRVVSFGLIGHGHLRNVFGVVRLRRHGRDDRVANDVKSMKGRHGFRG